jgi:molybdate transport system substrate-binding protein
MTGPRPAAVVAAAVVLLAAGCAGGADPGPAGGAAPAGTVVVFAAASLTESFTEIGADLEAANPGLRVSLNFAGSSGLAGQIAQGAPADVFASANPVGMASVAGAGALAADPVVFARNQLVIAVAEGNPLGIGGPADLAGATIKVALCAPQVPCGAAAATALEAAGVRLQPVTQEQDVRAALTKLVLGEVDAALVYRTDAPVAALEVDAVEFPESAAAVNDYLIGVLREAPNPAAARAFVDQVRSPAGQSVLSRAGFLPADPPAVP